MKNSKISEIIFAKYGFSVVVNDMLLNRCLLQIMYVKSLHCSFFMS